MSSSSSNVTSGIPIETVNMAGESDHHSGGRVPGYQFDFPNQVDKNNQASDKEKLVLRDFQKTGVQWFQNLYQEGKGGILADEMGLGKTVQTCSFLNKEKQIRTALILCPMTVIDVWIQHLKKWSPRLKVINLRSTDEQNATKKELRFRKKFSRKKLLRHCAPYPDELAEVVDCDDSMIADPVIGGEAVFEKIENQIADQIEKTGIEKTGIVYLANLDMLRNNSSMLQEITIMEDLSRKELESLYPRKASRLKRNAKETANDDEFFEANLDSDECTQNSDDEEFFANSKNSLASTNSIDSNNSLNCVNVISAANSMNFMNSNYSMSSANSVISNRTLTHGGNSGSSSTHATGSSSTSVEVFPVGTKLPWDIVIVDEAHRLKDHNSKRNKGVRGIKAAAKFLLTGTPVQNEVKDLWSMFLICVPDLLGKLDDFTKLYINPITKRSMAEASTLDEELGAKASNQLMKTCDPYVLRRLKDQVLKNADSQEEGDSIIDGSVADGSFIGDGTFGSQLDDDVAFGGLGINRNRLDFRIPRTREEERGEDGEDIVMGGVDDVIVGNQASGSRLGADIQKPHSKSAMVNSIPMSTTKGGAFKASLRSTAKKVVRTPSGMKSVLKSGRKIAPSSKKAGQPRSLGKTEVVLWLKPTEEQDKFYRHVLTSGTSLIEGAKEKTDIFGALNAINYLKSICNAPVLCHKDFCGVQAEGETDKKEAEKGIETSKSEVDKDKGEKALRQKQKKAQWKAYIQQVKGNILPITQDKKDVNPSQSHNPQAFEGAQSLQSFEGAQPLQSADVISLQPAVAPDKPVQSLQINLLDEPLARPTDTVAAPVPATTLNQTRPAGIEWLGTTPNSLLEQQEPIVGTPPLSFSAASSNDRRDEEMTEILEEMTEILDKEHEESDGSPLADEDSFRSCESDDDEFADARSEERNSERKQESEHKRISDSKRESEKIDRDSPLVFSPSIRAVEDDDNISGGDDATRSEFKLARSIKRRRDSLELGNMVGKPDNPVKLQEVCCKLGFLANFVPMLVRNGHRVVLFSNSTRMLDLVQVAVLRPTDLKCLRIDGSVNGAERTKKIARFQNGKFDVILSTTKVGEVGIDLTAADRIILIDPGWTPAMEKQAIDRCDRMTQKNHVVAYRLLVSGKIEERMLRYQLLKETLTKNCLREDTNCLKEEEGGSGTGSAKKNATMEFFGVEAATAYFSEKQIRSLFEYIGAEKLETAKRLEQLHGPPEKALQAWAFDAKIPSHSGSSDVQVPSVTVGGSSSSSCSSQNVTFTNHSISGLPTAENPFPGIVAPRPDDIYRLQKFGVLAVSDMGMLFGKTDEKPVSSFPSPLGSEKNGPSGATSQQASPLHPLAIPDSLKRQLEVSAPDSEPDTKKKRRLSPSGDIPTKQADLKALSSQELKRLRDQARRAVHDWTDKDRDTRHERASCDESRKKSEAELKEAMADLKKTKDLIKEKADERKAELSVEQDEGREKSRLETERERQKKIVGGHEKDVVNVRKDLDSQRAKASEAKRREETAFQEMDCAETPIKAAFDELATSNPTVGEALREEAWEPVEQAHVNLEYADKNSRSDAKYAFDCALVDAKSKLAAHRPILKQFNTWSKLVEQWHKLRLQTEKQESYVANTGSRLETAERNRKQAAAVLAEKQRAVEKQMQKHMAAQERREECEEKLADLNAKKVTQEAHNKEKKGHFEALKKKCGELEQKKKDMERARDKAKEDFDRVDKIIAEHEKQASMYNSD